jgi:hypothetical protein
MVVYQVQYQSQRKNRLYLLKLYLKKFTSYSCKFKFFYKAIEICPYCKTVVVAIKIEDTPQNPDHQISLKIVFATNQFRDML